MGRITEVKINSLVRGGAQFCSLSSGSIMTKIDIRKHLRSIKEISKVLPSEISISNIIGEGGQGIVYLGAVSNKPAAVKVYFPGQVDKRIDREIAALQKLKCASIVRLLCSSTVDFHNHKLNVVATTLISGNPLDLCLSEGALSFESVGRLLYDVANAIDAMWKESIVHRDLKPSNIIHTENDRYCVIDLGLARHLAESSLTCAGSTWGTIGYLSPEQYTCVRQLTCKSDIYTLGIIALESCLGSHPTSGNQEKLFENAYSSALPNEASQWPYADLLKRMLADRPTIRPRPEEIINALSEFSPQENLLI